MTVTGSTYLSRLNVAVVLKVSVCGDNLLQRELKAEITLFFVDTIDLKPSAVERPIPIAVFEKD